MDSVTVDCGEDSDSGRVVCRMFIFAWEWEMSYMLHANWAEVEVEVEGSGEGIPHTTSAKRPGDLPGCVLCVSLTMVDGGCFYMYDLRV